MYLALIKIFPSPEMEPVIIDVLESLKGPNAANADCVDCTLTVGTDDDSRVICYTERWRSREALDRHLRSFMYARILEALESSHLPPVVLFYETNDVGGLELVELARNEATRR
jgi:quinol monooxygenase YgiN